MTAVNIATVTLNGHWLKAGDSPRRSLRWREPM